jgi:dinuclear metal center YbgI/SA1388 family protein
MLSEVIEALEARYPPALAEAWDAVGLVCGAPEQEVTRVLFAVDPTEEIADEAASVNADLIVTHHPLFLTPVHGVAAVTPGGRLVHRLIREGRALFAAHTNADRANPGVSDALADALGLLDLKPLVPDLVDPAVGLGRWGRLPDEMPLSRFVEWVATAVPATAQGVRAAGDPDAPIRQVAVCGGSGESLSAVAEAVGVDVFVTADCKHHRTLDHRAAGGCAIVDLAHWASEWPWLPVAASALRADLDDRGATVETLVSTRVTDPWSLHVRSSS